MHLSPLTIIATAGLSLSTSTGGAQCYGYPATLVCTHPVLPREPEFPQPDVNWRRNGLAISTIGLGRSKFNSTNTRLQFTITEDTIGNYTCFLVNPVQGGINKSNSVSVRPPAAGEYITLTYLFIPGPC